uniref:Uncharacterized protein n=1 Tax=Rhizophora mucronata TaxID=61149 RepID=A0A2P2PK41_RHIMU
MMYTSERIITYLLAFNAIKIISEITSKQP